METPKNRTEDGTALNEGAFAIPGVAGVLADARAAAARDGRADLGSTGFGDGGSALDAARWYAENLADGQLQTDPAQSAAQLFEE